MFLSLKNTSKKKTISDRYIQQYIDHAMDEWEVELPGSAPTFRASKLPYCGVLDLLEHLNISSGVISYKDGFYTSIGTAVHALWQYAMVNCEQGKKAFGRWKCPYCSNVTKVPSFRPKTCPKCKAKPNLWQYEEIFYQYGNLTAHSDMVVQDDKGKFVLMELKTTSINMIKFKSKNLPYAKHPIQVETYATLLKLLYDIDIDRYVIVYTSRENFNTRHICEPVKFTEAMFEYRLDHIKRGNASRNAIAAILKGESGISKLVKNRPCHSVNDYRKLMQISFHDAFSNHDTQECELLKLCTKGKEKSLGRLLDKAVKEHGE